MTIASSSRSSHNDGGMQAEWRRNVQDALDRLNKRVDEVDTRLDKQVGEVANQVASIKAILDTYAQMAQSMAGDRMSKAMYEAAHRALEDRVVKLESGPGKMITWALSGCGVLAGIGSFTVMLLTMFGGLLVFVLTHK